MNVPSVLIIEDEMPLAKALLIKCQARGLAATIAPEGQTGLRLALQDKPDVILLDLVMPIMNGPEFLHRIRLDAWGATVPIIVLTNIPADSEDLIRAVVQGAPEFYLVKSDWRLEDIIDKVWEIIDPEGVH